MRQKQVVVTGIGLISSLGFTHENVMQNIKLQKDVSQMMFGSKVIPILDFQPQKIIGRMKQLRYVNRAVKFGICAAEKAILDADLTEKELQNTSLFTGTGPNLNFSVDFPLTERKTLDHNKLQALWLLKYLPNTLNSILSMRWKIQGENATIGNACAASTQAIGEGFLRIQSGRTNISLVGGADSRLFEGGLLGYQKASALHKKNKFIPFSKDRSGFVPGEGAGFLVLEERNHAIKRNAKIYAELIGFGSSMDAYSMTDPEPNAIGAQIAIKQAIKQAGIQKKQIDVIFAHGTGTPKNDEMEANMIAKLFINKPFVTSLKSYIGHLSAGCGAVESAISILLQENPPSIKNLTLQNVAFPINFFNKSNSTTHWITQNFGFGGQNAVLVWKKFK